MNRLKSLDPPHKGLRNALAKLALTTGKTNFGNQESTETLKMLAKEVFFLLKDHTRTENKFILSPLEMRNVGSTDQYFSDHDKIDQMESDLVERYDALNGTQSNEDGHHLYLDFCSFQSLYLEHINEEDSILEAKLHLHFTDEELMHHQIEIMQAMSFDTLLLWFKYIVPARRSEENAQVLSGFKSVASETAYATVLETIKAEVDEQEMSKILSMVV